MGAWKAPGPNGFATTFFQMYWDTFGGQICNMVGRVFDTGHLPKGINNIVISIILNVDCPQSMTHFRPISLCNTFYKIISKGRFEMIRAYGLKF